ncbi:MAG TPA: hypothetical protein VGO22_18165, partial [Pseudorhizobium sp.]|nr:hypothetical protein [Pseudorhizobium sp.]
MSIFLQAEHEFDAGDTGPAQSITAGQALVSAALGLIDTRSAKAALASASPQLLVIGTPSAGWSKALAIAIEQAYENVHPVEVSDLKKDGNRGVGNEVTNKLSRGRHVVVCSHDPAGMVPV